ncbi:caspase family protein [Maridesulfovibrio sp.]|uniref:caspase family protein n=1 Tax=Maridesulfovibrio sp. TaxID=2795000 RepID=UPI002A18C22A|nr:caspase family protein [Maridesulfovibrio sp.]
MRRLSVLFPILLLCLLSACGSSKNIGPSTKLLDQDAANAGSVKLYIADAAVPASLKSRIEGEKITAATRNALLSAGADLVASRDEADYLVQSKVRKVWDSFDNMVDVALAVRSVRTGRIVYMGLYSGDSLIQSASISKISSMIGENTPQIFALLNTDYAETKHLAVFKKDVAVQPVKMPVLEKPVPACKELMRVRGRRTALVIGNGAYKNSPLKNPANDAADVADSLRKLGFSVIRKNDVSLREMDSLMTSFYESLSGGGIGLFYYAGHGVQVNGENYLVPVDASINSESDLKYEAMNVARVLSKMEDAGNSMNIVILDACRNDPFARSFRSGTRGLARMDAPAGAILAYSTAPGHVAADGDGDHGIYTKYLLRHMMTPDIDINTVFIRTRTDVIKETGGKQIPWESSSLLGSFYFREEPEKK